VGGAEGDCDLIIFCLRVQGKKEKKTRCPREREGEQSTLNFFGGRPNKEGRNVRIRGF